MLTTRTLGSMYPWVLQKLHISWLIASWWSVVLVYGLLAGAIWWMRRATGYSMYDSNIIE